MATGAGHRHRGGGEQYVTAMEVDSATVIDRGDIVCMSSKKAVPASTLTAASSDLTLTGVADAFIGIARDSTAAGEATDISIDTEGLAEMPITSGTYKSGEMVSAALTDLSAAKDAEVAITTDTTYAIGVIMKNYDAATTSVLIRFWSSTHGSNAHQT